MYVQIVLIFTRLRDNRFKSWKNTFRKRFLNIHLFVISNLARHVRLRKTRILEPLCHKADFITLACDYVLRRERQVVSDVTQKY